MTKYVKCQMCQNNTHKPEFVWFHGWNRELQFPVKINICPRCHLTWKDDIVIEVVEGEKKEDPILEKNPWYYKKICKGDDND